MTKIKSDDNLKNSTSDSKQNSSIKSSQSSKPSNKDLRNELKLNQNNHFRSLDFGENYISPSDEISLEDVPMVDS